MMGKSVLLALRWLLSLGRKFAKVVPFQTLSIVCLTLVSQLAALLAAFMPLKVVILLGSERIPAYFPDNVVVLGREYLIVLLSLGTLGFFITHLMAEKLIRSITAWGATRLLQSSQKMMLFENQEDMVRDAYQKFSRALAGWVFALLALLGLVVFYPAMAAVQLGYLAVVSLLCWLLSNVDESFHLHLVDNLVGALGLAAGVGFFISFGYLVVDFLFWNPPNVIVGVVALLLSRQIMQRVTGLIGDLSSIQRQKIKIDALLFHEKVLLSPSPSDKDELWRLMESGCREEWVSALLREYTNYNGEAFNCRWHQTGVHNVVALKVESGAACYLIKLFSGNRGALALHESTLLAEDMPGLPALPLLGVTHIGSLPCLIYELPKGAGVAQKELVPCVADLNSMLMGVRPADDLQQLYKRSRPMLWQRLRKDAMERLRPAVTSDAQETLLDELIDNHAVLIEQLKGLPLYIHVPDIQPADIFLLEKDGGCVFLNWTRWALEPIGAGWLVLPFWFERLELVFKNSLKYREELKEVLVEQVELSALSFAFEAYCQRQRFSDALELVPEILDRLNFVKSSSGRMLSTAT